LLLLSQHENSQNLKSDLLTFSSVVDGLAWHCKALSSILSTTVSKQTKKKKKKTKKKGQEFIEV
jgi:hypothetical protein